MRPRRRRSGRWLEPSTVQRRRCRGGVRAIATEGRKGWLEGLRLEAAFELKKWRQGGRPAWPPRARTGREECRGWYPEPGPVRAEVRLGRRTRRNRCPFHTGPG